MPPPGDAAARPARPAALALAALAALIYLVLGASLMRSALFGGDVVSPAAFWAQNGPFPATLRTSVPPGINLLSDNVSQFTPWLRYAADSLARDGSIPLWKGLALCGAPLVGNGQSALFYPTRLLGVLLGAPAWFGTAQSLFTLVAGALGAYLLGRHLRLSFLAALLAGLVFGFGGFQVVFLQHPHTLVSLLLPLLLLCTDRLVLAPSAGKVGALALVAGLQHLGGHPETTVHCQLAAVALGLARVWSLRRVTGVTGASVAFAGASTGASPGAATSARAGSLAGAPTASRRSAMLVGALALGALLGAIQTVPLLEYIAHSDGLRLRGLRTEYAPPQDWPSTLGFVAALTVALLCAWQLARGSGRLWISAAGLLLATLAGLLAGLRGGLSPTWIALISADWFGPVTNQLGPVNYVELNGAFTGAALPLALFGLLAGRAARVRHGGPLDPRRGVACAAGILLLLGLLAAFRAPGLTDLLGVLPGLQLAENARLSLLALLATAVLAGLGLDALGRSALRPRLRLALLLGALLLGGWGALAYGVVGGRIDNANVPAGDDAVSVHALPAAEVRTLLPRALLDKISAALAQVTGPHKVFAGWFVSPAGAGAGAPGPDHAALRLTDGRLLYSRANRSVEALVTPALRSGNAATPWLAADGTPLCVFLAIVPAGEFPPGISSVRLRLSLSDGRALLSTPLQSPDDPGANVLPFPAQPAPGPAYAQLALLAVAVLALLALLDARGALRHGARALLVILCGASLLPFVSGMLPLLPKWAFYPRSGALDALAGLGTDARLFALSPGDMPAEVPAAYGLRDVRGYDALHPLHTAQLLRRATDHAPWVSSLESLPTRADLDLTLLGVMGVRCLAGWDGAPAELSRIPFRDEGRLPQWAPFPLVRNPAFLSRARLVTGRVVEPDDERALDTLAAPGFPHATTVTVSDGAPCGPSAEPAGTALITADTADAVRVAVQPRQACTLVLADSFYPGWKAFVDGAERPIARVNVAFRGVALEPGDRSVEFRYEPLSFRLGAAASAVGAIVLLLLAITAARAQAGSRPGRKDPRAAG